MLGQDAAFVREIASELDREERLIAALRYADDLSVPEIASLLEVEPFEVEVRLDTVRTKVAEAHAARSVGGARRSA